MTKELQDFEKIERKTGKITIRTTKTIMKWMNTKNISPTKVFNISIKKLMEAK